jgi:hypothetical protein
MRPFRSRPRGWRSRGGAPVHRQLPAGHVRLRARPARAERSSRTSEAAPKPLTAMPLIPVFLPSQAASPARWSLPIFDWGAVAPLVWLVMQADPSDHSIEAVGSDGSWRTRARRPVGDSAARVAMADNRAWNLCGTQRAQPVAISGKSRGRRSGEYKPKPLPVAATGCRRRRMVRRARCRQVSGLRRRHPPTPWSPRGGRDWRPATTSLCRSRP